MSKVDSRYMEFSIGGQLYAIPLLSVKEVLPEPEITDVPNMPSHFEGMMNLRGQILGVFNVRKRLGAKPRAADATNSEVVIVMEQAGVSVGMLVDEVTQVLNPDPDKVRPAPLKEDDQSKTYISSVIQTGEDLVLILDIVHLLELAKYKREINAA